MGVEPCKKATLDAGLGASFAIDVRYDDAVAGFIGVANESVFLTCDCVVARFFLPLELDGQLVKYNNYHENNVFFP
jgi:hypothetical protein